MAVRAALFVTACVALALVPVAATPVRAAGDGPYPVWWSDELELESLDRVEARLRRDLWPDSTEGMELYVGGGPDGQQAQARDCDSLLKLSEAGYQGLGNPNIKVQLLNLAYCRAIALLGQAKPARVSYLRALRMNAGALDYLPAQVNLYASCEFVCYAVEANERGIPFTKFETPLVVDVRSSDEMLVWTTGSMVILTIVGRGDFTADGVDDMLLLANGGATEGTYGASSLYLMTRDAPGAVLRVIDAERELCPDYNCHPFPPDIAAYRDSSPPPSPADIGGSPGPPQPGSTAIGDTPPYPVWWSPGYGIRSLDEIGAWLRRDIWAGFDHGLRLIKGPIDSYTEAEARTCDELEALTQAGYGVRPGWHHVLQSNYLLDCRTVALFGTAQPSRESFLRDFVISQESSRDLLRALGLVVGGGVSSRNGEMLLTRGLGKLLVVDLIRAASGDADIWADKGRVLLRVEARGDFTGDGIEDLLFSAGTRRSRYRPKISDLCLVTREATGAPLRMIEVAPYSCREPGKYGRPADDNDSD
ncbi:MAG: hypothetical protein V3T80_03175 [Kiloniellales bacterium]